MILESQSQGLISALSAGLRALMTFTGCDQFRATDVAALQEL